MDGNNRLADFEGRVSSLSVEERAAFVTDVDRGRAVYGPAERSLINFLAHNGSSPRDAFDALVWLSLLAEAILTSVLTERCCTVDTDGETCRLIRCICFAMELGEIEVAEQFPYTSAEMVDAFLPFLITDEAELRSAISEAQERCLPILKPFLMKPQDS